MSITAHLSPMISIPKKSTDEVDWTTPIRTCIAQSYGENPDNYSSECASLQRCRQDAVRGAGSDLTARDMLYKYFGQLELLELRFPEIRVNFPWHDAFTNKLITQTSVAYEKASILFLIASTHSSIAASQSRSDPEGLKRAFHYFRSCVGMLTYVNENFLHAPSTDLSREVVKFLINLMLAQATEVFFEKCTDEKKGNTLVSKIASQAASVYLSLTEEVKEFIGKGIFDRNWITVIQIKSKLFSSLAQYYQGLADAAAGKYGGALARYTHAETLAKDTSRSATSFASSFSNSLTPTLPSDAGTTLQDRAKTHLALCSERRTEMQRENDLIYHDIVPGVGTLPAIEKAVVATPIHIHDVYNAPEVQKTIGQDFFIRLIPLSIHESASVYSEEKAKLVRGEVDKMESADAEARSALDAMGVKAGLVRYKAMVEGDDDAQHEVPLEMRRWKEDIALVEDRAGVDGLMRELLKLKTAVHQDLDSVSRDLEVESKECEKMRVKYEHLWSQLPSASLTKTIRQDLKTHYSTLEAAVASDQRVSDLWNAVRADIQLLLSPHLDQVINENAENSADNLLDVSSETDDAREMAKIKRLVEEIEERLARLNKIAKERMDVLKDLKDKVQSDDVSHLLLLNRRNTGGEPTLFASELEKFRPYQHRLAASVHHQEVALQESTTLWKNLKSLAARGPGARKWESREKWRKDMVSRFSRARDGYMEVRDGLAKGLQFYNELVELAKALKAQASSFVSERTVDREALISKLETERRLAASSTDSGTEPPLPPPPPSVESAFAGMRLSENPAATRVPSPPQQRYPNQPWQAASPSMNAAGSPKGTHSYQDAPLYAQLGSTPSPHPHPRPQLPQNPQRHQQMHDAPGGILPARSHLVGGMPPAPPPTSRQAMGPPPLREADPYAALAMFGGQYPASPPPLPQPSTMSQYQTPSYPYHTPSRGSFHASPPPPTQYYTPSGLEATPQSGPPYPPPPPAPSVQYNSNSSPGTYGPPPPPTGQYASPPLAPYRAGQGGGYPALHNGHQQQYHLPPPPPPPTLPMLQQNSGHHQLQQPYHLPAPAPSTYGPPPLQSHGPTPPHLPDHLGYQSSYQPGGQYSQYEQQQQQQHPAPNPRPNWW